MIDSAHITETVRQALAEDLGAGDVSAQLIPADTRMTGRIIAREACVLAGRPWAEATFLQVSPATELHWLADDGEPLAPNQCLAELSGPARALLTAERTALNFLQTLSATATATRAYVDAIRGTRARILDTRKTLPGLRLAQKYAVTCGGGVNHRLGLYDMVLIKENHIMAAGSIRAAVAASRALHPCLPLEVEVETLAELDEALAAGVQRVLLDNFDLATLRQAVKQTAGRATLEASGNVDIHTVRAVAETGVDFISIGALTKHIQAVDLSLRFTPQA
ncbi:carboxylating nicotinate-nucleotide diphosphorylase [Halothiobacillus sp. DCM-1]|uniref:carboxylating nicotinate-nucleotide diphosphorylase n=1 Tax=Halothiobacillus sp. DCM-1 TaxID=3112558 RepID=UPI0032523DE2